MTFQHKKENNNKDQINLFDTIENSNVDNSNKLEYTLYAYSILKLEEITNAKLKEIGGLELFNNIEMPLVKILGQMQYNGMHVEKEELKEFGDQLKLDLEKLTNELDFEINNELKPIEETQKKIQEINLPNLKTNTNEEIIKNLPEWSIEPPVEIKRG